MGRMGETKEVKRVEENLVVDVKKNWMSWKEIYQQKITNSILGKINYKFKFSNFKRRKISSKFLLFLI